MNKPILTIGLAEKTNEAFGEYVKLDHVSLVPCRDVRKAMELMEKESFRLIIYNASEVSSNDIQETVRKIRRICYTPMVVICADTAVAVACEVGADAYASPALDLHTLFSVSLAQIRRNECFNSLDNPELGDPTLYRGDLIIDSGRHAIIQSGKEVQLWPLEFRLIAFMAKNAGLVLRPEQVSPAIWLDNHHTAHDVRRVVSTLRRKLNDDPKHPRYIQTVHGVGYRFLLKG